jgi:spermidine/putrescine transport system ATP-binding protein
MSDRIAVMFEGQIAQIATPEELYRHPATQRVASFIGVMNFLAARVTGETPDKVSLDIDALGAVDVPRKAVPDGLVAGTVETIGIRPEMLTILFEGAQQSDRVVQGTVAATSYYGDMTYYDVTLPGQTKPVTITMRNTAGRAVAKPGSTVSVGWGAESVVLFA